MGEKRVLRKILADGSKSKRPLGRHGLRRVKNIKKGC
jgi:hypothetical protein